MSPASAWLARNPAAKPIETRRALLVARIVAREYASRGASAVVLAGSWARGNARRLSDLDLWAFVKRDRKSTTLRFTLRQGVLVSVMETTTEAEARAMRNPERAGQVVLAWREAIPLFDPTGVAARLKRRAQAFDWNEIGQAADAVVAKELLGWAEEAVKLTRLMADGDQETAAVQRNHIADSMAGLVAIQKRRLYNENDLRELVGRTMGNRWREVQRTALGVDELPFEKTCEAALELYRLTVQASLGLFTSRDRRAISHVCTAVGHPL